MGHGEGHLDAQASIVAKRSLVPVMADGSKLEGATHRSTSESPATLERRPLPPSLPPTAHRERAEPSVRVVGWAPDGSGRHIPATHRNANKHGLDGIHDPRSSTDDSRGQAWSASGGEHGRQSPRRGATRPSGTRTQDAGALDRGSLGPHAQAQVSSRPSRSSFRRFAPPRPAPRRLICPWGQSR